VKRRSYAGLVLTLLLLAPPSVARGDSSIMSPQRLRQLALLDLEIDSAVQRKWQEQVQVRRWRGRRDIVVARDATLRDLSRAAPSLVRQRDPGVWDVRAPVIVVQGATLVLEHPEAEEVRLVSSAGTFGTLVAMNASIRIVGDVRQRLRILSWDYQSNGPDLILENGRGSVSIRGVGRLDAADADFSYLGFGHGRVSGVSLNGLGESRKASGDVYRSRFAYNVNGAYTFQAQGMRWIENLFEDNIVYGFDPHDSSDGFLVEHNIARRNGRHGIILSRLCDRNVVRFNISEDNGWHGIVIDDGRRGRIGPSNFNLIYRNIVRRNGKVGISVDGSNDTTIHDNTIEGGQIGIRVYGDTFVTTRNTLISRNIVRGASSIGVLLLDSASSTRIIGNTIVGGYDGVAVRGAAWTTIERTTIRDVTRHGITLARSRATVIGDSRIVGAGSSPIGRFEDQETRIHATSWDWNFPLVRDIARTLSWFVAPGLWALIFLAVIVVPLFLRTAVRDGSAVSGLERIASLLEEIERSREFEARRSARDRSVRLSDRGGQEATT